MEPQLHLQRPDHHGREFGVGRAAASSTRASARCATSCRTTCCRSWRCSAMEPPVGVRRRRAARREGQAVPQIQHDRPGRRRARPVPRLQRRGRRRRRLRRRDLRRPQFEIDSWRWAGVPWLMRTGKTLPVDRHRGGGRVQRRRPACCSPRRAARARRRTTCASGSATTTAIMLHLQAKAPGDELVTAAGRPRGVLRQGVRPPGRRPTSGCSRTRCDGDARRFGRADSARGAVAHRRARCCEQPAAGPACTTRARGARAAADALAAASAAGDRSRAGQD